MPGTSPYRLLLVLLVVVVAGLAGQTPTVAQAAQTKRCGKTQNAYNLVANRTSCARARSVEKKWVSRSTRGECGRGCRIGRYRCGPGRFTASRGRSIARFTCSSRSAYVRWYVNTSLDE